jgi:hypothetical protein
LVVFTIFASQGSKFSSFLKLFLFGVALILKLFFRLLATKKNLLTLKELVLSPEERQKTHLTSLLQKIEKATAPRRIQTLLKTHAQKGILPNEAIYKKIIQFCIEKKTFNLVCICSSFLSILFSFSF